MAAAIDTLEALPPWDAAAYFQLPVETTLLNCMDGQQLCAPDPNRVGLIFATQSMSSVNVSMVQSGNQARGMPFAQNMPPLMLTFADWGTLVHQAWYFRSSFGSANVTVFEIKLQRWPARRAARRRTGNANPEIAVQRGSSRG